MEQHRQKIIKPTLDVVGLGTLVLGDSVIGIDALFFWRQSVSTIQRRLRNAGHRAVVSRNGVTGIIFLRCDFSFRISAPFFIQWPTFAIRFRAAVAAFGIFRIGAAAAFVVALIKFFF